MNYIILDFEWDGTFYTKIGRFINQILQIGAVKLDGNFEIVDTFERTIKSSFSKRVSKRFTELTGITKENMMCGVLLSLAVEEYNRWAGDNAVTLTWSNSDLYTLIENEKHLLNGLKFKIDKYLDLQSYIQGEMRILGIECKSQISLLNAAQTLNVEIDEENLHNAKTDSIAAGNLLKKYYNQERFCALVQDTDNPEFFARLLFKPHFISDINDESIDKSQLDFVCDTCNKPLKRLKKWHFKCGTFFADMYCENCRKKYSARVKFRKYYDRVKVNRKLIEIKPAEGTDNGM